MKATPYVTGGEQRIVLSADATLPKGEQSVFYVAPLTPDELYAYIDRLTDARFPTLLAVCVERVRRVTNFPAGAPVPFPVDGTDEQKKLYLAQLGPVYVRELGDAILDQQFVKADGPEVD